MTATRLDPIAGRGAHGIRDDDGTLRQQRLLQVVLGHVAAERREQLADAVGGVAVLDERHAEHACDRLVGQVVGGRPDAARRDDDVGQLERPLPCPGEAVGVVADGEHRDDVEPEAEELVGDPAGVGVGDPPGGELVARRQDGDALDHTTARRTRVTSPA